MKKDIAKLEFCQTFWVYSTKSKKHLITS